MDWHPFERPLFQRNHFPDPGSEAKRLYQGPVPAFLQDLPCVYSAAKRWHSKRREQKRYIYTEHMDAKGLGCKLLLTTPGSPGKTLKSRPWVLWLHLTRCSPCKHFWVLSMPPLQRDLVDVSALKTYINPPPKKNFKNSPLRRRHLPGPLTPPPPGNPPPLPLPLPKQKKKKTYPKRPPRRGCLGWGRLLSDLRQSVPQKRQHPLTSIKEQSCKIFENCRGAQPSKQKKIPGTPAGRPLFVPLGVAGTPGRCPGDFA